MKVFFHIFGAGIVAFWLVMMGLLVQKTHFKDQPEAQGHEEWVKPVESPHREWKEIFLKDKKVGYAVNLIKPFGKGYFIQEEIFLKLNLMGLATAVRTTTQSRVDDQFLLESFYFNMTSGVVSFHISGKVEGDRLIVATGKGKGRRIQRIPLESPPMVGAVMGPFFRSRKIEVGETFRFPIFDPSTMAQAEVVVRVAAREPVRINKMTYDAFRLETEMWGKLITFWLDENGSTLKEEGFMGLTTVRSSAARAPRDLEAWEEDVDLYEMTAVRADRVLSNARRLSSLKLEVDGLEDAAPDPTLLNTGRQRFHMGIMEITRERLPSNIYPLPYDGPGEEIRSLLEPEFNIESDDEAMISQAREITGTDDRPVYVARKLLNWVYRNLEKKPVISVPSALEVLRTRVGDCNEHATLLAALLRASGIPSRLSVGLVYTRERFFYHAWTEAYVGEWITMDATLNQMPVDATHIKLIEGNLDKQVQVAGLIGTLKIKVIDYRYD